MPLRLLLAALVLQLAGCAGLSRPSVWTVADLAQAIEANLASVSQEVSGEWVPEGAACGSEPFDMSLGAHRPPFVPDVAALAALVPGAVLTYEGEAAGQQRYKLGEPGPDQATILRNLSDDGITWHRANGDVMELFPDYLAFHSGRLTLYLDDDAMRIQVGGASLLELERC